MKAPPFEGQGVCSQRRPLQSWTTVSSARPAPTVALSCARRSATPTAAIQNPCVWSAAEYEVGGRAVSTVRHDIQRRRGSRGDRLPRPSFSGTSTSSSPTPPKRVRRIHDSDVPEGISRDAPELHRRERQEPSPSRGDRLLEKRRRGVVVARRAEAVAKRQAELIHAHRQRRYSASSSTKSAPDAAPVAIAFSLPHWPRRSRVRR